MLPMIIHYKDNKNSLSQIMTTSPFREDAYPTERTSSAIPCPFLDAIGVKNMIAIFELIERSSVLLEISEADSTVFTFQVFTKI